MGNKSESNKVYLAAPLFSPIERLRNIEVSVQLVEAGFDVFIPQLHSGEAKWSDTGGEVTREDIFKSDVQGILGADIIVALLDGRVPDEGTVFEVGTAYALGKKLILINDDDRSFMNGHMNVMLEECVTGDPDSKLFRSKNEAIEYLVATYASEVAEDEK